MKTCSKCDQKHYALGLCKKHYTLQRNADWRALHRDEHLARRKQMSRGIGQKFSKLKSVARNKGLDMTLTIEQFTALNSLPCEYCGEALSETGYGIDRKDNSFGYVLENSLPCCTRCNTMKSAYLTYEEMKLIWKKRKGNPMDVSDVMGKIAPKAKSKKEIKHIIHSKSHNGKHIMTHVHHNSHEHPDETHVHDNLSDVSAHLEQHAGTPNEGEAAPMSPDAGGPAQMTAAPSPMPGA